MGESQVNLFESDFNRSVKVQTVDQRGDCLLPEYFTHPTVNKPARGEGARRQVYHGSNTAVPSGFLSGNFRMSCRIDVTHAARSTKDHCDAWVMVWPRESSRSSTSRM
jgi:hypothetical protein